MDMDREKKIVDAYPEFFPDFRGDPAKTCLAWGLAIGNGWANLFETLCRDIKAVNPGPDFAFMQVKEKFGGLRTYCSLYNDQIEKLIEEAEANSFKTCESCGTTENVTVGGLNWIQTLCNNCRQRLVRQ